MSDKLLGCSLSLRTLLLKLHDEFGCTCGKINQVKLLLYESHGLNLGCSDQQSCLQCPFPDATMQRLAFSKSDLKWDLMHRTCSGEPRSRSSTKTALPDRSSPAQSRIGSREQNQREICEKSKHTGPLVFLGRRSSDPCEICAADLAPSRGVLSNMLHLHR